MSTRIPDLTPAEFARMSLIFPLLSLREKLAVTKAARAAQGSALAFRHVNQPTDPKAIR